MRNPWSAEQALAFLNALRLSPGLAMLVPTERHGEVLEDVAAMVPALTGNLWHDTETAVLMREHGIRRICTRDMDFHRFPFLEPVDPLSGDP